MSNNKKTAQVFHFSLQGKRDYKYDFLNKNSLSSIDWKELTPTEPNFFFVEKDFEGSNEFEKYIDLRLLFLVNSMGIATGNDDELVSFDKFKITEKFNSASNFYYRPFDVRFTIFDNSILQRARFKLMNNYIIGDNLGLNIVRQSKGKGIETLITNNLTNRDFITNHTYNFPLYLYPEKNAQQSIVDSTTRGCNPLLPGGGVSDDGNFMWQERVPNLNMEIVNKIAEGLGIPFVAEKQGVGTQKQGVGTQKQGVGTQKQGVATPCYDEFAPIDLLDYIYAVLHSPSYREKYKEFLKIDFPRVPFPSTRDLSPLPEVQQKFWQLVKLGGELRQIHLLESPKVEDYITQYPIDGDNVMIKPRFINSPPLEGLEEVGKVYISETQYFDHVPQVAWEFYIGGYQPAQKWLKDRKDRKLEFEDILHYQKIIVALTETDRIMREIDKIEVDKFL
jgi:predicted helicase